MPDWTKSMKQTYEFMTVDPYTWRDVERKTDVTNSVITRDLNDETLGSAQLDCDTDLTDVYIRTYLVTTQNHVTERFPLGTYLYQTPGRKYDGKKNSVSADGYTPLIELKEKPVDVGYAIRKGENILERAIAYTKESLRAPVTEDTSDTKLQDDFVSTIDDTRLKFLSDLLANDNRRFGLDEMGGIIFPPNQDLTRLQPRWTYTDDNSSIIYPDLDLTRDLYGVPNVVEVLYSPGEGEPIFVRVVNDDENSVTSVQARGREIVHRDTNPSISGTDLSKDQIEEYAKNLLKALSSLEYEISYTHGYCPVRIGDCVRLDYRRAGLIGVKAKVTRQIINCTPGCPVQETAVFTKKLWG